MAINQIHNNGCDGAWCRTTNGDIRVLKTGSDSNALLCVSCFNHEMRWRIERNLELSPDCRFDLPTWESLKIYKGC